MNNHPFDLIFVAFFPKFNRDSYMEFQQKIILGNFSKTLYKPRLSSFKICEISPYFLQFYSGFELCRKIPKKFTQVLSHVVCMLLRRNVHKQVTKGNTGKKIQEVFCQKTSFVHSRSGTYYALYPWVFWSETLTRYSWLCVLSFGWDLKIKFVPPDLQ